MNSIKPRRVDLKPGLLDSVKKAQLCYWCDESVAIHRTCSGKIFRYVDSRNRPIREERVLTRIRKLAIPPAWTDVRICPTANGHLQATGRDARGRKQYRYHERWRTVRDESKFERLIDFVQSLPKIRRRIRNDLKLVGLPREKVLAVVVNLLETTLIRIGNEEYAKQNKSYGLTTLKDSHARIQNGQVRFEFRGKSGIKHSVAVQDRHLARIVKSCQELPGQDLFQYLDEKGRSHPITSTDVNRYLQECTGREFTAKDFRTWGATLLAARAFGAMPVAATQKELKSLAARAVESVARELRNTPAVCCKCYIHTAIVNRFLDGTLITTLILPTVQRNSRNRLSLSSEEKTVLKWLDRERRIVETI